MKISKRQLRRIIKEEKTKLLERMGGLEAHGPDDYTMYQVHPTQFVDAAKEYLTDEEFSAIGQDKIEGIAIDNANDLAWSQEGSQEGFGSSDRSAYIKYYLEDLGHYASRNGLPGFTADWKGPRGSLQIVRENKVKITKRQLRRIIKEEKRKLLRESLSDTQFIQKQLEQIDNIVGAWAEQLDGMFEEDPEAFAGRSTKEQWIQQVDDAHDALSKAIKALAAREMERVEMELHDGQFTR